MAQMNCMIPRENLKLRITTGDDKDQTVYVFGLPDSEGFRKVQRNDEEPYRGIIVGAVLDIDDIRTDGATVMTELKDDDRRLVHNHMLTVGNSMGIWTEPNSKETQVSRPITKIEII